MTVKQGEILEGKVTGIAGFGAFVTLPDDSSGLVHISEISDQYVKNVKDFVKVGDTVKVKVLSVDDDKIALSMKQAKKNRREQRRPKKSFEDQLQAFLKVSNEKNDHLRSRYKE